MTDSPATRLLDAIAPYLFDDGCDEKKIIALIEEALRAASSCGHCGATVSAPWCGRAECPNRPEPVK